MALVCVSCRAAGLVAMSLCRFQTLSGWHVSSACQQLLRYFSFSEEVRSDRPNPFTRISIPLSRPPCLCLISTLAWSVEARRKEKKVCVMYCRVYPTAQAPASLFALIHHASLRNPPPVGCVPRHSSLLHHHTPPPHTLPYRTYSSFCAIWRILAIMIPSFRWSCQGLSLPCADFIS